MHKAAYKHSDTHTHTHTLTHTHTHTHTPQAPLTVLVIYQLSPHFLVSLCQTLSVGKNKLMFVPSMNMQTSICLRTDTCAWVA